MRAALGQRDHHPGPACDDRPDQVDAAARQVVRDERSCSVVRKRRDQPAAATERGHPGRNIGCLAADGHPGLRRSIGVRHHWT